MRAVHKQWSDRTAAEDLDGLLEQIAQRPGHLNREIGNIEIDPLTAPRNIQAIVALYGQLSQAQRRYPGTDLVLRYEVNPTPALHELPLHVRSPGPQAHRLR